MALVVVVLISNDGTMTYGERLFQFPSHSNPDEDCFWSEVSAISIRHWPVIRAPWNCATSYDDFGTIFSPENIKQINN